MPKVLTKEQIKQYHEEGFIFPIQVIPKDEALAIAAKIEEAERLFPQEIHAKNRNNLHLSFSFLDKLVHNKIVVDAMEDLLGPDLALWATVMFIKEPSSEHYVSWHQDATYMGMNANRFATPWISLSTSDRNTGCMTMIPGAHLQEIVNHEDTFDNNNILTRGQIINNVDESLGVDLILEPGEMSIHSGTVVHASKPNRSNNRRIGFALQSYMPPNIKQVFGKNFWTHVRGKKRCDPNGMTLDRPRYDMDPNTVAQRKIVNENLARILYKDSDIKRNY
ncbi:MAG: phytanoyl-CoA dioxygenase [Rhodospirillaceae bacterium]|nr:phytanoyl-CoA dioxygenase [Rhodospirillaceae bacterium]